MTADNYKYVWSPEIQELQKVANTIDNHIVLAIPNFDFQFILTVDAYEYGYGAILFQQELDQENCSCSLL